MGSKKRVERKPLSFSTTIRNPERIAVFLKSMVPFEGEILTNEIIKKIIKYWLINKLIRPDSVFRENDNLKSIFYGKEKFTDEQAEYIYNRVIQITKGHKEAGFDKGWPSRFQTYMMLPRELGFIYYNINQKIQISETGKLLIDSISDEEINENKIVSEATKVSDVFLNALVKYQTNNPFRRNLIENAPFVLTLQVIKRLEKKYDWEKTGIYRNELPFIICWPDANADALAEYINFFRTKYGVLTSDEIVYEKCLELLESNNSKRFKKQQITKESVDDFIRKFRITGLISLRGQGRLIDINRFEEERVFYIIDNYSDYPIFEDEFEFYKYMGKIDGELIRKQTIVSKNEVYNVKVDNLKVWSEKMKDNDIANELSKLSSNSNSKDPVLKYIPEPTRFEFLMSIALYKRYPEIEVVPNYPIDDEGMPTSTALGGIGDIEVYTHKYNILVEVTLMRNKSQSTNEIPGITRHLNDLKKSTSKEVFSLFIAPSIHPDTKFMINFSKSKENPNPVNIYDYTIENFIKKWRKSKEICEFQEP